MIKKIAFTILLSSVALLGARAQATDDFETGPFTIGTYNGGSGFGVLTALNAANTGGTYASNSSTDNRQIDGLQSLGIYSGMGIEDLGRTLNTPLTSGTYSVDARFDLNNATNPFTGLNITSGQGATFGANELLSVGLVGGGNSSFLVTDGTGTHALTVGTDTELRGNPFNFSIAFNTLADTYTLTVTDTVTSQVGTISGSLEGVSPGAVAAVGFQNGDSEGGNQNFIVDNTTVSAVPEPGTVMLLGPALLGGMFFVRRRRA